MTERPSGTARRYLSTSIVAFALAVGGPAFAGSAHSQSDPADLAFWNSIANSKNPAEYRAYLETFPNGRFAPLARLRAGPMAPTAPEPAAPAVAATAVPPTAPPPQPAPPQEAGQAGSGLMNSLLGAVKRTKAPEGGPPAPAQAAVSPATAGALALLKAEWRASDAIRFRYDLQGLPPGSSHRVKIAPAGSPTAITEHFAFETESLFLKPPSGTAQTPPMPPGRYEARLYLIPQGRAYYELADAKPFTVAAMKPGRFEAGAVLSDLGRGEVPFLAKYRGKLIEIEGPFHESSTSGDNLSVSLGPVEGGAAKGSITCLAPLSNDAALQEAAAIKKGDTIVAGGFVHRVDTRNQTITLQPCAASANLDITFTRPEAKAEAQAQPADKAATAAAAAPPAPAAAAPPAAAGTPSPTQTAARSASPAPSPARPASPPPPTAPAGSSASEPGATPDIGARYAEIPKPPQAPVVNVARTLSLASLRFPGDRPKPVAEPHLTELINEFAAKNKLACQTPQAHQWDTNGWDNARLTQTIQSVAADLKAQGFVIRRLESQWDNMVAVQVDNPKGETDRPLLLVFYVEEEKDFYLIACATK